LRKRLAEIVSKRHAPKALKVHSSELNSDEG
jgi:hypothetical protein